MTSNSLPLTGHLGHTSLPCALRRLRNHPTYDTRPTARTMGGVHIRHSDKKQSRKRRGWVYLLEGGKEAWVAGRREMVFVHKKQK